MHISLHTFWNTIRLLMNVFFLAELLLELSDVVICQTRAFSAAGNSTSDTHTLTFSSCFSPLAIKFRLGCKHVAWLMGCYIQSCLAWCSLQEPQLSLYPFDYDTGDSCVTSSVLINSEENCICMWIAKVTYSRCTENWSDWCNTSFLLSANWEIFPGGNPSTSSLMDGKSCPAWIICHIKEPKRRVVSVFSVGPKIRSFGLVELHVYVAHSIDTGREMLCGQRATNARVWFFFLWSRDLHSNSLRQGKELEKNHLLLWTCICVKLQIL